MFKTLKTWRSARRARPLAELLAVDFDESTVRVRVLAEFGSAWNQECRWDEITRVCFRDGGLRRSDEILLDVRGRSKPVLVLTEAAGGPAFVAAIGQRGLFPPELFAQFIGSTAGNAYCWPPSDARGG